MILAPMRRAPVMASASSLHRHTSSPQWFRGKKVLLVMSTSCSPCLSWHFPQET